MNYAGLLARSVAFLLDALMLAAGGGLVALFSAFFYQLGEIASASEVLHRLLPWEILGAPTGLALVVAATLYWPTCEALWGATPGKLALGLRVCSSNGGPVSWKQAWVRRLSLFFGLIWFDSLLILVSARKQRGLDLLADTVVVYAPVQPRSATVRSESPR
ncbi:MAG: RDD family protein [Acidobacteriota bacterium]